MAIVHVTSWSEFVAAVAVSDNEVIVDNDIDCNGEPLESVIHVYCSKIDGNDHIIYNLTSTGSHNDFQAHAPCEINKLHFYNYVCYANTSSYGVFYGGSSTNTFTFKECKMQGITFKPLLYTYGGTLQSCSLSFTQLRILKRGSGTHCTECWIDIGNTTPNSGAQFSSGGSIIDCYIKGKFVLDNSSGMATPIFNNTCTTSVFNFEITKPDTINTLNLSTDASTCIYNSDRIKNLTGDGGATPLTDTQLKDASAVAATGFPIVT